MKTLDMRRAVQAVGNLAGAPREASPCPALTGQTLDSGVLFAGGSEVLINHGGEHYRLRLTRQNRLILTK